MRKHATKLLKMLSVPILLISFTMGLSSCGNKASEYTSADDLEILKAENSKVNINLLEDITLDIDYKYAKKLSYVIINGNGHTININNTKSNFEDSIFYQLYFCQFYNVTFKYANPCNFNFKGDPTMVKTCGLLANEAIYSILYNVDFAFDNSKPINISADYEINFATLIGESETSLVYKCDVVGDFKTQNVNEFAGLVYDCKSTDLSFNHFKGNLENILSYLDQKAISSFSGLTNSTFKTRIFANEVEFNKVNIHGSLSYGFNFYPLTKDNAGHKIMNNHVKYVNDVKFNAYDSEAEIYDSNLDINLTNQVEGGSFYNNLFDFTQMSSISSNTKKIHIAFNEALSDEENSLKASNNYIIENNQIIKKQNNLVANPSTIKKIHEDYIEVTYVTNKDKNQNLWISDNGKPIFEIKIRFLIHAADSSIATPKEGSYVTLINNRKVTIPFTLQESLIDNETYYTTNYDDVIFTNTMIPEYWLNLKLKTLNEYQLGLDLTYSLANVKSEENGLFNHVSSYIDCDLDSNLNHDGIGENQSISYWTRNMEKDDKPIQLNYDMFPSKVEARSMYSELVYAIDK